MIALAIAAGIGAPLVGVAALGGSQLVGVPMREPTVVRTTRLVSAAVLASAVVLAIHLLRHGPTTWALGSWYGTDEDALELVFRVDGTSVAAAAMVALISSVGLRFSEAYLHREPGHLRFFTTTLLAVACLGVIALAGTLDVLFVGWELLGLCSFLLIGFFHERREPVQRALRAIFSYRAADSGLLLALFLLHEHGTEGILGLSPAHAPSASVAAAVGLLLLLTASGKAGMVPFSGWLARSTEGPTPSSALFYAGLSVHAGPYLLLRAFPLYGDSLAARAGLVALGLVTALSSSLAARTRTDAKGAVVMAGGAQIGLIVAEIGLGLHTLAGLHMAAHIGLRTGQLLLAPAALAAARTQERWMGRALPEPSRIGLRWWLLASEGWSDRLVERAVGALMASARATDRASLWVERWLVPPTDRQGQP